MPPERFHLAGAEILVGADVDETARIAAGQFAALARKRRRRRQAVQRRSLRRQHAAPSLSTARLRALRRTRPLGRDSFLLGRRAQRPSWRSREQLFHGAPAAALPGSRSARKHPPHPHRRRHRHRSRRSLPANPARNLPLANGLPRFDYVLLGLGANGHTASLFPHRPTLHEQQRLVVADHVDEVNSWRVTLTAPVLNNAAQITFLVTGEAKAAVVQQVIEGPRDPEATPAQLIAPTDGSLPGFSTPPPPSSCSPCTRRVPARASALCSG